MENGEHRSKHHGIDTHDLDISVERRSEVQANGGESASSNHFDRMELPTVQESVGTGEFQMCYESCNTDCRRFISGIEGNTPEQNMTSSTVEPFCTVPGINENLGKYLMRHFGEHQEILKRYNDDYGTGYYYCLAVRVFKQIWLHCPGVQQQTAETASVPAGVNGELMAMTLVDVCRFLGINPSTFRTYRTKVKKWEEMKMEILDVEPDTRQEMVLHDLLKAMLDRDRLLPPNAEAKDRHERSSAVGVTASTLDALIETWKSRHA